MRQEGFVERYTDFELIKLRGNIRRRCDLPLIDFYSILEQSWYLYQSTHIPDQDSNYTHFPMAWKLEEGDRVLNISKKEVYKVSRAGPMLERESNNSPSEQFQDFTYYQVLGRNINNDKLLKVGVVGFTALLTREDDGSVVQPPTEDILMFQDARYMKIRKKDVSDAKPSYVPNPSNPEILDEVDRLEGPYITYYKRREEPASTTGKWFSSENKNIKPKFEQVTTSEGKSIKRRMLLVEFILRFDINTSTSYDRDKLEIYFHRFVERLVPVWLMNGLNDYAYWKSETESKYDKDKSILISSIEYGFRLDRMTLESEQNVVDVNLKGPVLSEEGATPTGEDTLIN